MVRLSLSSTRRCVLFRALLVILIRFNYFISLIHNIIYCIGQNYQEDHFTSGVQGMQDQEATLHQANQALRVRREEEDIRWILNIETIVIIL